MGRFQAVKAMEAPQWDSIVLSQFKTFVLLLNPAGTSSSSLSYFITSFAYTASQILTLLFLTEVGSIKAGGLRESARLILER